MKKILMFVPIICLLLFNACVPIPILEPARMPTISAEEIGITVFEIINSKRQDIGLHQLTWSEELYKAAKKHSDTMLAKDALFHSFNGYAEAACHFHSIGNNASIRIVETWENSEKHRDILFSKDIKCAGVGIAYDNDDLYATFNASRRSLNYE